MRYTTIIFILILFFTRPAFAQYYDTGEDPGSVKWLQIKTSRFTVIYPDTYGDEGITYAKTLDDSFSKLAPLFDVKKSKIPVVIHSLTSQSNGYVSWAPRRMELYPTPEQNTIPMDPAQQLAIHEFTHVLQMESLNTGFSKVLSYILGEQSTGVVSALLPLWFFEGEAIFSESLLTESGRGRYPFFQKQLKALTVGKSGIYKYDKVLNDSYRDYVPDHYQSGYQMVTWALAKYDQKIWNKVLSFTGKEPFTINPVNISLRKNIGLTKKKLFNEAFDSLKTIWSEELAVIDTSVYYTLNPSKNNNYINYYSPVFAGNDSIIALKASLSFPASLVLIKPSEKSEKHLFTPGKINPLFISYGKGKLVWVENQPDPRWNNRNYSIIKIMDLKSKKVRRLSTRSRYLAAAVSPDGRKIAAIENSTQNTNYLKLIDASSGQVLQTIAVPGNAYLQHPQWSENGKKLTVISLTDKGEGIMSYDFPKNEWKILLQPSKEDIQSTFLRNDSLFYISSLSGTDNVYLQTPGNKTERITSSGFGTTDINIKSNNLIFSDYSSTGNNICIINLDETSVKSTNDLARRAFLINRFDKKPQPIETNPGTIYTPEPYRKWQHLFRFHSWMPFYADLQEIKSDPGSIRPGVTIMTQNVLSTLISTVGYEFSEEKNHEIHSRITWKGWYPIFESQLDYGHSPGISKLGENVADPARINRGIRFSNTISIPFRFSSGRFSQYLRPSVTVDYKNNYVFIKETGLYDWGQTILSGRTYFSNYSKVAIRDIYPRWAQTLDLNFSFAPFDKSIYGSSLSLKTSFYFPGLLPNHSVKLRAEIEKQNPVKYSYVNRVSLPRGYKNINSRELEFLSVDYVLPLVYPDLNISSLLYLKRIRTGFFYDFAMGTGNSYYIDSMFGGITTYFHDYSETFSSFGLELLADFHILRIPFMISGGVRSSWKSIKESPSFEILFNIDLFGMTLGKHQP